MNIFQIREPIFTYPINSNQKLSRKNQKICFQNNINYQSKDYWLKQFHQQISLNTKVFIVLRYIDFDNNSWTMFKEYMCTHFININRAYPCNKFYRNQILSKTNKQLLSSMKSLTLLGLICTIAFTYKPQVPETVLLSSNTSNTIIVFPLSFTVENQPYHTKNNPNYIGYNAQWLWKTKEQLWDDVALVFQTYFYVQCSATVTLVITADNIFSAVLNNEGAPYTGNNWKKIYRFSLNNIKCGLNSLRITVENRDRNSLAALIFAVVQNQSNCFSCSSPLSFFNRKTCQCECLSNPTSPAESVSPYIIFAQHYEDQYQWKGYPTCGYACPQRRPCQTGKYFNDKTCNCQCQPRACLPAFTQCQTSCLCITHKINLQKNPSRRPIFPIQYEP